MSTTEDTQPELAPRTTEIRAWRGDDGLIILTNHLPLTEDTLPDQAYRVEQLDVTDADNPAFAADLAQAIAEIQDRCATLQQRVWAYEDDAHRDELEEAGL